MLCRVCGSPVWQAHATSKGYSQLEHICWRRFEPVRDNRRMAASKVDMEREERQSEHRLTSTECLAPGWPEAGLE